MGKMIEKEGYFVYLQENGEITARFPRREEKLSLAHKGSPKYRKVFYLLVGAGALYLAALFAFVH